MDGDVNLYSIVCSMAKVTHPSVFLVVNTMAWRLGSLMKSRGYGLQTINHNHAYRYRQRKGLSTLIA